MQGNFPPPPGQAWLLSGVYVPVTIAMMVVLATICVGLLAVWRWRVRATAVCNACGSDNDEVHFLVMQKDGQFTCNICAANED